MFLPHGPSQTLVTISKARVVATLHLLHRCIFDLHHRFWRVKIDNLANCLNLAWITDKLGDNVLALRLVPDRCHLALRSAI
jgi:hypothetical protein